MPPKKKKTAKKAGRRYSRKTVLVDGIPLSEMTKDQLEEHVLRLREELELEREERNYFQIERDRVSSFYDIVKSDLANRETDLLKKEIEIAEAEEKHQAEITLGKQKVKHLLYEQQQRLAQVAADHQMALTKGENKERAQGQGYFNESKELRIQLKEQELANMAKMRDLKIEHEKNLSDCLKRMEKKVEDISKQYEEKLTVIRRENHLRGKMELQELEERKNRQLRETLSNHNKTVSELKSYYKDITENNLALINTMKDEIASMRIKEDRLEKTVEKLSNENSELKIPLQEAREELSSLKHKLANYQRDQNILESTKQAAKSWKKELKALRVENEILTEKCLKLERERASMHDHFSMAIQEVQQRCGLSALLAEKKLRTIDHLMKEDIDLTQPVERKRATDQKEGQPDGPATSRDPQLP